MDLRGKIRAHIERRVDIDQVDLATVLLSSAANASLLSPQISILRKSSRWACCTIAFSWSRGWSIASTRWSGSGVQAAWQGGGCRTVVLALPY